MDIKLLGKLPIDPEIAKFCDNGEIEKLNKEYLDDAVNYVEKSFWVNPLVLRKEVRLTRK